MDEIEQAKREAVIAEARSWFRTPFHDGARIKGVGVDCGQFVAGVFEACGWEPMNFPPYKRGFFLHVENTLYLDEMRRRCVEVERPQPGDVALFKIGRSYGHGVIIVDWPFGIHAREHSGVELTDVSQGLLSNRPVIYFDPYEPLCQSLG